MKTVYGHEYESRYERIAQFVPVNSSVTELCAGFGDLYTANLKHKSVRYTGYDINRFFIKYGSRKGVPLQYLDITQSPIPPADIVIIQASLYQFYSQTENILEKLLGAANSHVIISEPVKNLSDSNIRLVSLAAKYLANPGDGHKINRFDAQSFRQLMNKYYDRIQYISNYEDREILCVLSKNPGAAVYRGDANL